MQSLAADRVVVANFPHGERVTDVRMRGGGTVGGLASRNARAPVNADR